MIQKKIHFNYSLIAGAVLLFITIFFFIITNYRNELALIYSAAISWMIYDDMNKATEKTEVRKLRKWNRRLHKWN
jgi:5-bromo-4-chloroindolyl phosphate hydrolysis protein